MPDRRKDYRTTENAHLTPTGRRDRVSGNRRLAKIRPGLSNK